MFKWILTKAQKKAIDEQVEKKVLEMFPATKTMDYREGISWDVPFGRQLERALTRQHYKLFNETCQKRLDAILDGIIDDDREICQALVVRVVEAVNASQVKA